MSIDDAMSSTAIVSKVTGIVSKKLAKSNESDEELELLSGHGETEEESDWEDDLVISNPSSKKKKNKNV